MLVDATQCSDSSSEAVYMTKFKPMDQRSCPLYPGALRKSWVFFEVRGGQICSSMSLPPWGWWHQGARDPRSEPQGGCALSVWGRCDSYPWLHGRSFREAFTASGTPKAHPSLLRYWIPRCIFQTTGKTNVKRQIPIQIVTGLSYVAVGCKKSDEQSLHFYA